MSTLSVNSHLPRDFLCLNGQLSHKSPCNISLSSTTFIIIHVATLPGLAYSIPCFAASMSLTALLAMFPPPGSPYRQSKIYLVEETCYHSPFFLTPYNRNTGSSWSRGLLRRPRPSSFGSSPLVLTSIPHRLLEISLVLLLF